MTNHPSYGDIPRHIVEEAMAAPWGAAEGIIERYRRKQRDLERIEKKNQTLRQSISDIRITPKPRRF